MKDYSIAEDGTCSEIVSNDAGFFERHVVGKFVKYDTPEVTPVDTYRTWAFYSLHDSDTHFEFYLDDTFRLWIWHRRSNYGHKDRPDSAQDIPYLIYNYVDNIPSAEARKAIKEAYTEYCDDDSDPEAYREQLKKFKAVADKYVEIRQVYAYEHGGISFSAEPFSCPWDSGMAGVLIRPVGEKFDVDSYLAAYSSWCNGECYSVYAVEHRHHNLNELKVAMAMATSVDYDRFQHLEYRFDFMGHETTQEVVDRIKEEFKVPFEIKAVPTYGGCTETSAIYEHFNGTEWTRVSEG